MEEEIKDEPEVQETPAEEAPTEAEEVELSAEEIEDLKKRAEASSQNFERLKKAEEELKKLKAAKPKKEQEGLSNKDVLYLAKADIHEDDVDDVLDWAKFKGVTVKEAHEQLKDTLTVRDEQRKTAETTQVRGGQRGASAMKGEDILKRAEKGELPESDEDIRKLAEARIARLRDKAH